MTWLIIVILAHLFYALVFVIDKYILSRPLPHPIVYTFYVGILSALILVLIPFGFSWPNSIEIFWILIAGATNVAGLILFYKALNLGEVSRIVPFVGSFVAIFILILSGLLIGEKLTSQQLLGFALLVLGGLIIAIRRTARQHWSEATAGGPLFIALASALLFAIFWVITKYIFTIERASFINGLIWLRTGVAIVSLSLLLPRKNRQLIFRKTDELKPKTVGVFISGRVLGVIAALFMYLAVFLGSVTLTNSLQGLQYVFILVLALLLFKKFPSFREEFGREIIIQKIIAIMLIGLGLAILVV